MSRSSAVPDTQLADAGLMGSPELLERSFTVLRRMHRSVWIRAVGGTSVNTTEKRPPKQSRSPCGGPARSYSEARGRTAAKTPLSASRLTGLTRCSLHPAEMEL